jgi:hypothetical protein
MPPNIILKFQRFRIEDDDQSQKEKILCVVDVALFLRVHKNGRPIALSITNLVVATYKRSKS